MRYVEELSALADLLDKHVDNHVRFEMEHWFRKIFPYGAKECKTVCCAIGLGIHHKIFKHGLTIINCEPFYKGQTSFRAVTAYFQIDDNDTHHLFGWEQYDSTSDPKLVATRIREFIKQHAT